jgi:hypothetical protein
LSGADLAIKPLRTIAVVAVRRRIRLNMDLSIKSNFIVMRIKTAPLSLIDTQQSVDLLQNLRHREITKDLIMFFFSVGYREACFVSPKQFSIFNAPELAPGFFTLVFRCLLRRTTRLLYHFP